MPWLHPANGGTASERKAVGTAAAQAGREQRITRKREMTGKHFVGRIIAYKEK